jgi:hypothetical protein
MKKIYTAPWICVKNFIFADILTDSSIDAVQRSLDSGELKVNGNTIDTKSIVSVIFGGKE